eukprot:XP_016663301.1 PREDICTED: type-2 histone deacetylase 1-like isoform X2 [Acyrthosiphon pisum]
MTPFGIVLVAAVFSMQVMQAITQPKKYRCNSLRPLPQPESEPISSWILKLPPSVTKSSSTASKSPALVSKSSSSVINSSSSVPKSPSSVSKSPSSVSKSSSTATKSSSTVQKVTSTVTNSSRSANRLPPDSFSLFKLPLKLISSLLIPLIPPTIRQNTSSIISPLFSFQMPLTFSTIHQPNYLPYNTNNSTVPCNSLPGNTNNLPIPFNPLPGISNNLPISFNSIPGNTNNLPIPFTSTIPGNTNTLPTPCNSLPGNKNNSTNPCNSVSGSTNTLPNPSNSKAENANNSNNVLCNSLLGNSHKFIIYNWICNYLLNKIQNVSNIPPIELIPTPSEPNQLATDNSTVTPIPSDFTVTSTVYSPTEDTPNDNNTPNDNTPNDNTPNDNTSNDNIPISTPHYPIPPCMFTPINKIHTPCLPLIHIPKPKPKPCSVPVTYSNSYIPLKYCPPNHGSCSPSYAYFNSLFNPTTYKYNTDHTLNPQEEILLKILKSVISNPNL